MTLRCRWKIGDGSVQVPELSGQKAKVVPFLHPAPAAGGELGPAAGLVQEPGDPGSQRGRVLRRHQHARHPGFHGVAVAHDVGEHDRHPGPQFGPQGPDRAAEHAPGHAELTGGDPGHRPYRRRTHPAP